MKRSLFLQDIYIAAAAVLITVLVVITAGGVFGGILNIPLSGAELSADSVVMRGNEILYSTRELSAAERQKVIIGIKCGEEINLEAGVRYSIKTTEYKDGTVLAVLKPQIGMKFLNSLRMTLYPLIFLVIYMLLALWIRKKRRSEIILPLCALTEQTRRLSEGDFDINIPDSGADEIRRLSKCIENLRIKLKNEVYMNKKSLEDRQFLISSISHDLRTPVTAIRGYLEGILDGVASSEEKRKHYLEKSIEKTELINRMIGDLLLYSKLDLHQVEFKMQTIDLSEYLSAFTEEVSVVFERENKHISFDIQNESEYNVRVDMEQLDRVMGNITSNALRYICSGTGNVRILLRSTPSAVITEVRDNGIGIAEEDIPKIFDKFYRGEKSRGVKGSSGLGLAISKQIIESMGGRLWAKSRLGEGTSIMISLKKYKDIQ